MKAPADTVHCCRCESFFILAGFLFLALLFSGCATLSHDPSPGASRALRTLPEVPGGHVRAARALVAAFFDANGIRLTSAQIDQILPSDALQGGIDRNAIRRIAAQNNRVLTVVKADEEFLWDELGRNLPLLVLLPPDTRYSPVAAPLIPVAWHRKKGTVDLLDGNSEIQTMPDADFFARRSPLKHAALCLVKSGKLPHFEPVRDQKLLLADFWYDQGFYRRNNAVYTAIQEADPFGETDAAALLERGIRLIRKSRDAEAVPVFRAALALEPDNPKILNNLAYAMLHGDGELLVALRHAGKAAQLDPENPLVLETLGSINLRIGDSLAAAKYLEHAWARALRRSPEVQVAIMDQLVRAWLAADREHLAWQVADYRHRTFPEYRFAKDLLVAFPALRRAPEPYPKKI
jgi:tetratricopeptide (TPR) repeat protein